MFYRLLFGFRKEKKKKPTASQFDNKPSVRNTDPPRVTITRNTLDPLFNDSDRRLDKLLLWQARASVAELIYFSLRCATGARLTLRRGGDSTGPSNAQQPLLFHPMAVYKDGRSHRDVTYWFRSSAVGFQSATSGVSVPKREDSIVGSVGGSGGEK